MNVQLEDMNAAGVWVFPIAAVHADTPTAEASDWPQIVTPRATPAGEGRWIASALLSRYRRICTPRGDEPSIDMGTKVQARSSASLHS